jgi:hypothetical protein
MTASELRKLIRGPTLATISGELCKLTKEGVLHRQEGFGPRGGYGYSLKDPARYPDPSPTSWSVVDDDDFLPV